jgi:hypothetical protein
MQCLLSSGENSEGTSHRRCYCNLRCQYLEKALKVSVYRHTDKQPRGQTVGWTHSPTAQYCVPPCEPSSHSLSYA